MVNRWLISTILHFKRYVSPTVENGIDHVQISARLGSLYWYWLLDMYAGRAERVNVSSWRTRRCLREKVHLRVFGKRSN